MLSVSCSRALARSLVSSADDQLEGTNGSVELADLFSAEQYKERRPDNFLAKKILFGLLFFLLFSSRFSMFFFFSFSLFSLFSFFSLLLSSFSGCFQSNSR